MPIKMKDVSVLTAAGLCMDDTDINVYTHKKIIFGFAAILTLLMCTKTAILKSTAMIVHFEFSPTK